MIFNFLKVNKKWIVVFWGLLLLVLSRQNFLVASAIENELFLGGDIVGFEIDLDGALIAGFDEVDTQSGLVKLDSELAVGDLVKKIDGVKVEKPEDIYEILNCGTAKEKFVFTVERDGVERNFGVCPLIERISGEYKLGANLRSGVNGLGTLTFIDKYSNFGALGHAVGAVDNNSSGKIYDGVVLGIVKSENGNAGSIKGALDKRKEMGEIRVNNAFGLYGIMDNCCENSYKMAKINEIKTGKAQICSSICGKKEFYDAQIVKINHKNNDKEKGLIVKITDQKLCSITGGIVQGMSGSPILQNGKIVGAITHVIVNDTTMGYGIFVENMLGVIDNMKK